MTDTGDALAPGTRLDEFEIERVLGAGGFGVTYLARDVSLDAWRAVKEYLPRDWGTRLRDGTIGPRTGADAEDYQWGLTRFLDEARILAQFDHPHLVRVYRVFEAQGTAYMVTEYADNPGPPPASAPPRTRPRCRRRRSPPEEKKINTWKHTQRRNPMKITFTARCLLLSLVLLIVVFSNAPESHGQESVSYFDYYARGNFEKSWEALQDEVSARPVRQITYHQLDMMIKIAGYIYEQTGAISFADYHELLKQMLNQDSKWVLLLDLQTFVEYSEEIHSKKLSDESQWNMEIDRALAAGSLYDKDYHELLKQMLNQDSKWVLLLDLQTFVEYSEEIHSKKLSDESQWNMEIDRALAAGSLYDKDRRARLFALGTFFSRKRYSRRMKTNVADDKINLRWLFFAGKSQFMISSLNKQLLHDYVVHCEAQRGVHCDFTEEARYLSGVVPGCAEWNTEEFFRTATPEQVTACLAAGADVNDANFGDNDTPLHLAASSNENPAVIGLLLEAGADLEAREVAGETPLHWAAGSANAVAVEALLAAGANLEARGEEGRTPLHEAAMSYEDPTVVIGLLLEAGANLEAQVVWQDSSLGKGSGDTPLHEAADYPPAAVAALLAAGADVNARNRSGLTPLYLAARPSVTVIIDG